LANLHDQQGLEALRKLEVILAVGNDDAFVDDNRVLTQILTAKAIPNQLHIWSDEAHDATQWMEMVQLYL
jgi:esterase/lipase superfamily enzyme